MKSLFLAATTASLISFGMIANAAGDVNAGKGTYSACMACHGAAGEGGVGPKVAGQNAADLAEKITKYRAGEQVGPLTSMMAPMAANLSDSDIENLSAYMAQM